MDASEQRIDLLRALDPASYMAGSGLEPDPWQVDFLRSEQDALLNCTRQGGKSTVTAALAAHTATYSEKSLTLLVSPSLRQSGELFRKVKGIYRGGQYRQDVKNESALQLELASGSRVVSLPGKPDTILGYSAVDLLVIDEASRVPDELYYAVRPMLAVSGGRLVALSTPFGKRGWFFREWTEGGDKWLRFRVTADDCPRITQKFLDGERASMGDWWFRQEYYCEFVQALDSVFSHDHVMGAVTDEVEPLFS